VKILSHTAGKIPGSNYAIGLTVNQTGYGKADCLNAVLLLPQVAHHLGHLLDQAVRPQRRFTTLNNHPFIVDDRSSDLSRAKLDANEA
jgi:hypothetical protein